MGGPEHHPTSGSQGRGSPWEDPGITRPQGPRAGGHRRRTRASPDLRVPGPGRSQEHTAPPGLGSRLTPVWQLQPPRDTHTAAPTAPWSARRVWPGPGVEGWWQVAPSLGHTETELGLQQEAAGTAGRHLVQGPSTPGSTVLRVYAERAASALVQSCAGVRHSSPVSTPNTLPKATRPPCHV